MIMRTLVMDLAMATKYGAVMIFIIMIHTLMAHGVLRFLMVHGLLE
ncbi:hypothetical protein ES705_49530 [subsurface metagenome]